MTLSNISPVRRLLLVKPIKPSSDVEKTSGGLYVKHEPVSDQVFRAEVLRTHPHSTFATGDVLLIRKSASQIPYEDACFVNKKEVLGFVSEVNWGDRIKRVQKLR